MRASLGVYGPVPRSLMEWQSSAEVGGSGGGAPQGGPGAARGGGRAGRLDTEARGQGSSPLTIPLQFLSLPLGGVVVGLWTEFTCEAAGGLQCTHTWFTGSRLLV